MISAEAKTRIDALTKDELRLEVEKGHRSRFQGDNYAYASSRLTQLDQADANRQVEREHALMEEANRIAQDANARATWANRIAIASLIVALISALITIVIWQSS